MIEASNQKTNDQFQVLVVDDDHAILEMLKEVIKMVPGCEVKTASQPKEAMELVTQGDIDIVFTDVHMPGVTGIEMIQDIIALEQSPEVIVMTSYPSGEIAQEVMELGVTSLLPKPFEDISVVETELSKAIKKILRRRSLKPAAEAKKRELQKFSVHQDQDKDPVMKVDLGDGKSAPSDHSATEAEAKDASAVNLYPAYLMEPLAAIEINRCVRNQRQFAVGFVEPPENVDANQLQDREARREEQKRNLAACFRRSDVVLDLGHDGFGVLGFECNKPGSQVLEFKLQQAGFDHCGFAVYPTDGQDYESLKASAKRSLQAKKRHHILVWEKEEFFGRIVQNMLMDPKFEVQWVQKSSEAEQYIREQAEHIKVLILSLVDEPEQWKLLSRLQSEDLARCPIILFTAVPIGKSLRDRLRKLGVRAIIRKGASQEEFLYIVQSFVMSSTVREPRKNSRALATLPVVYRYESKEISSNTFTISRDGLFIRDMNPVASGSQLELELFIPQQDKPLKAKAEVIYSVPYFVGVNRIHVPGMAVRFVELAEEQKQVLDRLITESLTSYILQETD